MTEIIEKISVKKLFGYIDFNVSKDKLLDGKFYYIYAENGMGKTTFLDVIYALLANNRGEGQKYSLRNVLFSEIKICLQNGSEVTALRKNEDESDYQLIFENTDENIFVECCISPAGDGRMNTQTVENLGEYFEETNKFLPDIVYLNANRSIRTHFKKSRNAFHGAYDTDNFRKGSQRQATDGPLHTVLKQAQLSFLLDQVGHFNEWAKKNVYKSQSVGIRSSDGIFKRLLKTASKSGSEPLKKSQNELLEDLRELKLKSEYIFNYKFARPRDIADVISSIESIKEGDWESRKDIANLYASTTKTRFSSLLSSGKKVQKFLSELNSYFHHKEFSYDLYSGLEFKNKYTEGQIPISKLSSGERHLLLIFTLIFIPRSRDTIIFIDEPEISLSTVWQRKLSGSLKRLTSDLNSEFILATHSIEMLSDKTEFVVSPTI